MQWTLMRPCAFLLFHGIARRCRAAIGFEHLELRKIRTSDQNRELERLTVRCDLNAATAIAIHFVGAAGSGRVAGYYRRIRDVSETR